MAAVSANDESNLDELLAPDFVDHNPMPDQQPGREGFKQWMRTARSSFPDLQVFGEDVVAEDDRVAGRVRYRGTHAGPLVGVGGTGRRVEFEAFHVVRFRHRQIAEWWGTTDLRKRRCGGRWVRSGYALGTLGKHAVTTSRGWPEPC